MRTFTEADLQRAFNDAETDTAAHFDGRTCSLEDKNGNAACPLCHFRARVKIALGIRPALPHESSLTGESARPQDELSSAVEHGMDGTVTVRAASKGTGLRIERRVPSALADSARAKLLAVLGKASDAILRDPDAKAWSGGTD